MRLFNTLTRQKDEFKPLENNTARIYSCGPTVYSSPTIGNLRAYIFVDILKKGLELNGINVNDVMNTTDVGHLQSDADEGEDKIEAAAKREKIDPQAIARRYTEEFFRDCEKLNIRKPKTIAPASHYIPQMIEHIKGLEEKGFTYTTSDGVYFDSGRFEAYYDLRGGKTKGAGDKAGARIGFGEKRNQNDFCLWKFTPKTALQKWDSPWGVGCPGWHIECSAIARHHFGDTFDIHTGGVDHIQIHHTNEIAQTQALTGKPMCQFWLHNEFMTIDSGKMGKSLGNAYTLSELESQGYTPLAFRYFTLQAHYRTILNFTFKGLESSQRAYNNLVDLLVKHYQAGGTPLDKDCKTEFRAHMADDLNTPKALALVWELARMTPNRKIYEIIIEFDNTLSLGLEESVQATVGTNYEKIDIPTLVQKMADERQKFKAARDFNSADKLRDEIATLGYEITDTKDSYIIKKSD